MNFPENQPPSPENSPSGDNPENLDSLEAPTEATPTPEAPKPIDHEEELQSAEDLVSDGRVKPLEKRIALLIENEILDSYEANLLLIRCITKRIGNLLYLANAITDQQHTLNKEFNTTLDEDDPTNTAQENKTPPSEDAQKLFKQAELLDGQRTEILLKMVAEQDQEEGKRFGL